MHALDQLRDQQGINQIQASHFEYRRKGAQENDDFSARPCGPVHATRGNFRRLVLANDSRAHREDCHRVSSAHRSHLQVKQAVGCGDQFVLPGSRNRHFSRSEGEAVADRSQLKPFICDRFPFGPDYQAWSVVRCLPYSEPDSGPKTSLSGVTQEGDALAADWWVTLVLGREGGR